MTIEQQIRDYKTIKETMEDIRVSRGERRKDKIKELHERVRKYYTTYKTKYDPMREPR